MLSVPIFVPQVIEQLRMQLRYENGESPFDTHPCKTVWLNQSGRITPKMDGDVF